MSVGSAPSQLASCRERSRRAEACDTRERRLNVRRCNGDRLNAPRIETVVTGPTGPRHALLAEVVGDPGVATAMRARVIHDLGHARIGVFLELGLLIEVDGRAG